jgi:hypothetical protein
MSGPCYSCPDCDKVVWHDCRPASYWRGRRLPRLKRLPRLRAVDREEILEEDRDRWRITSPVTAAIETALGDRAYLDMEEQ